jgi:hypothetical protein
MFASVGDVRTLKKRSVAGPGNRDRITSTRRSDDCIGLLLAPTMTQATESIGAGEGNRTLVISLEGSRLLRNRYGNSDKKILFATYEIAP